MKHTAGPRPTPWAGGRPLGYDEDAIYQELCQHYEGQDKKHVPGVPSLTEVIHNPCRNPSTQLPVREADGALDLC